MSIIIPKHANTIPVGGPSPIIWADCPVVTMIKDPSKGIHFFEDFLGQYTDLTATGVIPGTPFSLVDDGGDGYMTVDTAAYDNEHGVIKIEPDGETQYDEAYIASRVLYQLVMNSGRKMWFEARIKFEDITADLSIICGLGDSTLLAGTSVLEEAAVPDTIESRDFVGFVGFTSGTAMGDIDAIYHEVGDAAVTQVKDAAFAAGDLVNDTYVKLGLKFDGEQTLTYYINGVKVGELDVDDFATVTANELTPLGIIIGEMVNDDPGNAGDATYLAIDWVRFACDRNDAQ